MRFASIGTSNAANYAPAGKAAADSAARMFSVQRKTGPDYAGLSKVAMAAQSAENIAAAQAEAEVAKAGLDAMSFAKRSQIRAQAGLKVNEAKIATRKAGILPAIGKIAAGAFKKDPKPPPPRLQVAPVKPEHVPYPTVDRPTPPAPANLEDIPTGLPSGGGSRAGSTSGGIPRTGDTATPTGGFITQDQGYQLLIDQGMDPDNARIGAAVMMAESGGDPNVRSHPDLEARTGEHSLGLWQHNKNTGEDRHQFYGIQDWTDLKDPQTNARATFRLWQRRGGWGDWGAYTDGSYKKYL